MKITFCGHAHFFADEFLEKRVIMLLEEKIGNCDAEIFLGGYGEFDSFAHRICWKYKQTHPKVSIALVIPYLDRDYEKEKYDSVIYPGLEKIPQRLAILYRNRWMVDHADILICYIDHSWGGAYKTYLYAKRKNILIINLSPKGCFGG